MSASNPDSDVFDRDAGWSRYCCRADPSHDPRLVAHPSKAMPDIRQAALVLFWRRQQSASRVISDVNALTWRRGNIVKVINDVIQSNARASGAEKTLRPTDV